jgi:hypothetical protein
LDGLKKEVSIKSVQWGIVSVINRKDIEDPEKGKKSRDVLRSFESTFLKDKDYVLNATTMERIKKLCDIDEKEKGPEPKKRKT